MLAPLWSSSWWQLEDKIIFFFTIFSLLYLRIQILFLILAACCFPLRLLWTCLTLTTRICSPSPFICHFIQICSPIHQQFLCFSPWSKKQNVFGFFFLTYFYRGTVISGVASNGSLPGIECAVDCMRSVILCVLLSFTTEIELENLALWRLQNLLYQCYFIVKCVNLVRPSDQRGQDSF